MSAFRMRARMLMAAGILSAAAIGAGQQSEAAASSRMQLAGMRVWLVKSLDSRKVKQGDPVSARPQAKVRLSNGVEFLPSTVLLGHVDAVQPSRARSDGAMTLTFDQARMKDGQTLPVKATILWIAPSPDPMNPSVASAPVDRATPGVGVLAGQTGTPVDQTMPFSGVLTAAPPKGGAAQPGGSDAGSFRQQNGIPGISLESNIRAPYSGVFRASRQNVELPEGTVMALAVVITGNGR